MDISGPGSTIAQIMHTAGSIVHAFRAYTMFQAEEE